MERKRNGFVAVILLVLIVADVSDASRLSGFRKKLAGLVTPPQDSGGAQGSPSPSPNPVNTTSNNSTTVNNPAKENLVVPIPPDNSTTTPKLPANATVEKEKVAQPPVTAQGDGKNDEGKKKIDTDKSKTVPQQQQLEAGENCTGLPRRCTDQNSLTACFLRFDDASRTFVVLVQNNGEQSLSVELSAPNTQDDASIQIAKHESKKINLQVGKSEVVSLNAGNGECVLHMDPSLVQSQGNYVFRLPSYDQLLTPVNGAYLLILTVVLFGIMWGCCCLFRKSRVQGELPYQELELSALNNELSNDLETAEGWDEGWDDDWNDDASVKSPATHAGSISANGLTARSANRDSWEKNWDD
ncbi:hypothetical protein LINPERPRIM_LOCUS16263 [Linum perenne]